jgi:hypothetical protein
MDRAALRKLSRLSREEIVRQLREARAEVERAASNMAVAMQAVARALPSFADQCSEQRAGGRDVAIQPALSDMSRAVIAVQYEDITGQALAHVGLRLRTAEAIIEGLAALQEATLGSGEQEHRGTGDMAPACTRLEDALARASAVRTPCTSTASAMSGGTIELL